MSYRDMRNFTEMMKSLGYPKIISMENFRTPNFKLLAEVIMWIIGRFDPEFEMPTEYDTETDRVMLIRSAGQFMASNIGIKVNMKHLYQADGFSVRELIKSVNLLYNALNTENKNEIQRNTNSHEILLKINNMKDIRSLVNEITSKGASLYDLVKQEAEMREIRNEKIHKQLELSEIENSLKKALESMKAEIINLKQLIQNVTQTEASLDSKIEKKTNELERNKKRLITLRKVKPAYQDEFIRLEQELKGLSIDYVDKFKNLAYLEQQMEEVDQAEQERLDQKQALTKKLINQFQNEENLLEDGLNFGKDEEPELEKETLNANKVDRPQHARSTKVRIKTATGAMRQASAAAEQQRRIFGNMTGPREDDEDSSGSLESDSDILLVDEDVGSELIGTDEDDDDFDDNLVENKRRNHRGHVSAGSSALSSSANNKQQRPRHNPPVANVVQPTSSNLSDDDF